MKALKKIAALILMLSVVISVSSCAFLDKVESFVDGELELNQKPVYKEEMVRLIVSAVNNPDNLADSYSSIPENQRKDVSYSLFSEYISILREYFQQGTKRTVTSFTMLTDEQLSQAVDEQVKQTYSDLVAAQLDFTIDTDIPCYVYLMLNSEGLPYLSYNWISGTIRIYNYANTYFNLLDEGNIEGINTMIAPSFSDAVYTDGVTRAKAVALADYYHDKVRSNRTQYVFESLYPSSIDVLIPKVIVDAEEESHNVHLSISDNGDYIIDDVVNTPMDVSNITLYREETTLIRCGATYNKDLLLYGIMGEPVFITYGVDDLDVRVNEDGSVVPKRRVICNYYGAMIILEAYITANGWVDGNIIAIKITGGENFSVGQQLYVGMSRSEILCIHPFADEDEYTISYTDAEANYEVNFEFDENDIATNVRIDMIRE